MTWWLRSLLHPFVIQLWMDPRLSWTSSNYDGIEFLTIEAANIWVPRIGLKNRLAAINLICWYGMDDWLHFITHPRPTPISDLAKPLLMLGYGRVVTSQRPLSRYVKLRVAQAPGILEMFSPPPRDARAVIHVGIANKRFPLKSMAGKTFPAFPAHAQHAVFFNLSGKRPMVPPGYDIRADCRFAPSQCLDASLESALWYPCPTLIAGSTSG